MKPDEHKELMQEGLEMWKKTKIHEIFWYILAICIMLYHLIPTIPIWFPAYAKRKLSAEGKK